MYIILCKPIFALPKKGNAQVAKLVDALCSGRSVRKDVLVRIQSWAPGKIEEVT